MNKEYLTYSEWCYATRMRPCKLARMAWEKGEDPTEYANN